MRGIRRAIEALWPSRSPVRQGADPALARSDVAVGTAEEGDGVGGLGMDVAFEAGPGAALSVPEVTLQAIRLVGVGGEHPAEQDVRLRGAGVLQEALAKIHVVSPDPLRDEAPGTDALQEIDPGALGRDRAGHVGLGQADGGLNSGRGRKTGEKGRLRRIGLGELTFSAGEPHLLQGEV